MKLSELAQTKVALWGYGVEGKATAAYLKERLPELSFTVLCLPHERDPNSPAFITDAVSSELLSQFEVVIKSPGISPYSPLAREAGCRFISSSALWFANERRGQVVAITGTKGKSTVSALVTHVLYHMGKSAVLAGNFGRPLISCLGGEDYVILETSSYQAQDGAIRADLAVLLNLYSEHLNWHLDEATYHRDKWRLLEQAGRVILNARDENTLRWYAQQPPEAACSWFNQPHGYYELKGNLMYQDKALLSPYGWSLKGHHNIINAAAVCELIHQLGLDIMPALNAIKTFQPLPHRLQTIAEQAGVTYIDDSIASTPKATIAALSTTRPEHTVLLLGGYDRGLDWGWFVDEIAAQPPKAILCSGENGEKIAQLILNRQIKTQCMYKPNLADAVKTARELAIPGDVVLLSPGAPSFDAFDDYQHRGMMFAKWIK
jgi:UDP-N-acetylmuramoylalanine--D-glutamate ligase